MTLPARQRLVQVMASLRRRLPSQLEGLLAHPRFAAGAAALDRLSDDALADAIGALPPDEAAAIADALLARWARLADVVLDPHAGIVHPDEVWIGARPVVIAIAVEVVEADVDDVAWDGAVADADPRRATITIPAPAASGPADVFVRAHVRARTAAGRCALVASARIPVRQPRLAISDDRRRVVATDHAGRPAVGVPLGIGDRVVVTGPGGLVEVEQPLAPNAALTLAGVPAGRVG